MVEIIPLENKEWTIDWLYYNRDMSESYKESPYVKVLGVEDYWNHYELQVRFHSWCSRYIMPSWIKAEKTCLFI